MGYQRRVHGWVGQMCHSIRAVCAPQIGLLHMHCLRQMDHLKSSVICSRAGNTSWFDAQPLDQGGCLFSTTDCKLPCGAGGCLFATTHCKIATSTISYIPCPRCKSCGDHPSIQGS